MIIIFSHQFEYSTNVVIDWLKKYNVNYIRINSDENRYKLKEIDEEKIIFCDMFTKKEYNFLDAHSVWYRRGGISDRMLLGDDILSEYETNVCDPEVKKNLASQLDYLRKYIINKVFRNCSVKLGDPELRDLNRMMLYDLAKKKGFLVPNYTVLTHTDSINCALKKHGAIVSKSIANGLYHHTLNKRYYTYTEQINEIDTIDLKPKNIFPSLVSEKIEKTFEIRSFFLIKEFYSVAIFSQNDSQTSVDYRKYNKKIPNRQEAYIIDDKTKYNLLSIYNELGLNTGSADLIIDADNNVYFLEINPVGQFGSVSSAGNYKLEKKVAQYLIHGDFN
ncbi:hypothetical protein GCM10028806_09510 [Spirosoma terrae]|uniref:Grasp-with-spasm system ATP-grasp peptide maturase n=1 Tax=Spirosoma terrae TaxID=1968276 RepID=A0A6L9L8U3_9BACT|nr:grasp-with-spasm system ATP-grasp peptide maturase [Spirosoma terrae]NDU95907.1 grasp-with-spasm system ATP-grasp peptide maturase [Spirosoma terrae]